MFGEPEKIQHLVGVLQGHCDDLGRDIGEITKTKLASLVIDPDEATAARLTAPVNEAMGERAAGFVIGGTPEQVAEQVQANLDAGLDGIVVNMPYVHDIEQVKLAGETLAKVIA